jgi:proline dehydrogenase
MLITLYINLVTALVVTCPGVEHLSLCLATSLTFSVSFPQAFDFTHWCDSRAWCQRIQGSRPVCNQYITERLVISICLLFLISQSGALLFAKNLAPPLRRL